jgi:hypothetical protein
MPLYRRHEAGKPFERENQLEIRKAALGRAKEITEAGAIVELPFRWEN